MTMARVLSEDAFLRKYGFAIVARPRAGPATWKLGGRLFDHKVAVKVAKRLEAEAKARGDEERQ